jgi:hypothetical protein
MKGKAEFTIANWYFVYNIGKILTVRVNAKN